MGKPVYLGKQRLWWCPHCNVPLLDRRCALCGNEAHRVKHTPPGEVRVGFEGEIAILKDAIRKQFGCEFNRKMVLFNRVPHTDRMDEIIIDGEVIGNLIFDTEREEFRIALRMNGAYLFNKCATRGYVVIDSGAVQPVLSGRNLMAPGVIDVSEGIVPGDEVIVRDPAGMAMAVGVARMSSDDMQKLDRGMAVKIRHSGYGEFTEREDVSIEKIVEANEKHLRKIESKAVEFIRRVHGETELPMAVSFSGGKDSLATLLLAIQSEEKFDVFFLDTGIEFPETVEYVDEVRRKYGLDIKTINAGDAFWRSLEFFGPPGRDYRWCCKVCKLGPTTRFIMENYPGGLLTLVGQRRYESEGRMRKGKIWRNDWVPNQYSVSPIQNWTSLEVWLYIFWKRAPVNVWYKRGLTRLGCYLCPSADLADFYIAGKYYEGIEKWREYLRKFGECRGADEKWVRSAWRWRHPPRWVGAEGVPRSALNVRFEGEAWKRVWFNREVARKNVENMLHILPEGTWRWDGELYVLDNFQEEARSLIIRAEECVACGICLGRCPTNALFIGDDGKIRLHETQCVHCLDCLGKCPAEEFN
ncbi:MAG: phosphoadenosine phosphosulfate reductase family protein [Euryarchaeota archaeon]|nr:phosphoadenosine phosphosulfate reductase family protein [Euryarchaeota archaeon]